MLRSHILDVSVPFFVPKRGRGHVDVLGKVNVSAAGVKDPLEFAKYISKFGKSTCNSETVIDMGKSLVKGLGLSELVMEIKFLYSTDRLSQSLEETFYGVNCGYSVIYRKEHFRVGIYVEVPIRLKEAEHFQFGLLHLELFDPIDVMFFEDIVDYAVRFADVKLYPFLTVSDREKAGNLESSTKTVQEHLLNIRDSVVRKHICKSGFIAIKSKDMYGMYKFEQTLSWVH